jgi:hypothetical protein
MVYPQALIQLECTLQDIKSTTAKRPKNQDDWCDDLLSRNASAGSSHACSEDEAQTRVVEGVGWGAVRMGANLKAVKAALGEGHPSHKYSNVYFVEYRPQGIEISFNSSDDTVHAIYFYNRQQGSEQFGVFCGQTDKGVNWKSTLDDVKSLYGHPLPISCTETREDWNSPASIFGSRMANWYGLVFLVGSHKFSRQMVAVESPATRKLPQNGCNVRVGDKPT